MKKKAKNGTLLWLVGFLATIWWGLSCLYVLLLVWLAKDVYVVKAVEGFSISSWQSSIYVSYKSHGYLPPILWFMVLGWIVLSFLWFKALRQENISYKAGLKDLFLTIRK